jgi:hypothetical protein
MCLVFSGFDISAFQYYKGLKPCIRGIAFSVHRLPPAMCINCANCAIRGDPSVGWVVVDNVMPLDVYYSAQARRFAKADRRKKMSR